MNRVASKLLAPAVLACTLAGCTAMTGGAGWTTLIDGSQGLASFNRVGNANWGASGGTIRADQGGKASSYLVTKQPYADFVLRVDFWASDDANSGVLVRCQDPARISDESCYEANIFDQRPDPTYGTGAIVKVAKAPVPMPKAGGRWNTYEVWARGRRLIVMLNGVKTVDVEDGRLARGWIALQWARGTIAFRKVEVKAL